MNFHVGGTVSPGFLPSDSRDLAGVLHRSRGLVIAFGARVLVRATAPGPVVIDTLRVTSRPWG